VKIVLINYHALKPVECTD